MANKTLFDYRKAVQAVNYFARKYPETRINKMKVLKLLWAADRYHLRSYGRTVLEDNYVGMKYGPVASTTRDILEKNSYLSEEVSYMSRYLKEEGNDVSSIAEVDEKEFSKTDKEALDFAFVKFGGLDQFGLAELTHDYPEWERFGSELISGEVKVVALDYIDFFKDPTKRKDDFEVDPTLLEQSKEIYIEGVGVGA